MMVTNGDGESKWFCSVAAFALSTYSNTTGRFRKFFNPLLGETYEYEQGDFKYHGEQVIYLIYSQPKT
ncbi:hypothetical protein NECAME_08432 [Necator americanus]|uniref:Uncharacterized protein n=1 Tax=Necator americanus TaxID=51031 RepID=W2THM9_NECAM|nr:hypothetical protein NECAME_08432 [Necator americanus]ETN81575.1 hypothetical protein NECAME_08432 [Necator americanus]